ncbi:hypothetical protein PMZ80_010336 [Knufia obscura]|uniref:Uncharacterized protein n=1 Tax=Knufia obscura TaxID=1635080 RepID=A0ABR0R9N4_9EURO|nr:hypothetical protein PMZ80_010336 [Knufia obscura]
MLTSYPKKRTWKANDTAEGKPGRTSKEKRLVAEQINENVNEGIFTRKLLDEKNAKHAKQMQQAQKQILALQRQNMSLQNCLTRAETWAAINYANIEHWEVQTHRFNDLNRCIMGDYLNALKSDSVPYPLRSMIPELRNQRIGEDDQSLLAPEASDTQSPNEDAIISRYGSELRDFARSGCHCQSSG